MDNVVLSGTYVKDLYLQFTRIIDFNQNRGITRIFMQECGGSVGCSPSQGPTLICTRSQNTTKFKIVIIPYKASNKPAPNKPGRRRPGLLVGIAAIPSEEVLVALPLSVDPALVVAVASAVAVPEVTVEGRAVAV